MARFVPARRGKKHLLRGAGVADGDHRDARLLQRRKQRVVCHPRTGIGQQRQVVDRDDIPVVDIHESELSLGDGVVPDRLHRRDDLDPLFRQTPDDALAVHHGHVGCDGIAGRDDYGPGEPSAECLGSGVNRFGVIGIANDGGAWIDCPALQTVMLQHLRHGGAEVHDPAFAVDGFGQPIGPNHLGASRKDYAIGTVREQLVEGHGLAELEADAAPLCGDRLIVIDRRDGLPARQSLPPPGLSADFGGDAKDRDVVPPRCGGQAASIPAMPAPTTATRFGCSTGSGQ